METEKKFNRRAFLSVGMFVSGITLPVSGLMNHTLGFEPYSPERHMWMSVHNISAILFTIFSILHIKLNWKVLRNSIKNVTNIIISKEALYAASMVLFFLFIAVMHGLFMNRPAN